MCEFTFDDYFPVLCGDKWLTPTNIPTLDKTENGHIKNVRFNVPNWIEPVGCVKIYSESEYNNPIIRIESDIYNHQSDSYTLFFEKPFTGIYP